jgi:glucosamine kinase
MPHARSEGDAATWWVGVDGGGSGTRARLQTPDGLVQGQGAAGPSGLSQGIEAAWRQVRQAIAEAFADAGFAGGDRSGIDGRVSAGGQPPPPSRIALSLGLAGAGVASQRDAFLAADPGYACCLLNTDAMTLLAGAHAGRAGIVVAAGTGSVAARMDTQGQVAQCGGWGFPVGDEGSGAWLGLRAMQSAQRALDGRQAPGPLAERVLQATGSDATALLAWCAVAGQHGYAQLAPLVFDAADAGDPAAEGLLQAAAEELGRLAMALQPSPPLPIVVGGSVGVRLQSRWPDALRMHVVPASGDSCDGALQLLRRLPDFAAPRARSAVGPGLVAP